MVNWVKRLAKKRGDDLFPTETLVAAILTSPIEPSSRGGVFGRLIAIAEAKDSAARAVGSQGIAGMIPMGENLVIGLTTERLLFWQHGQILGRLRSLVAAIPRRDIAEFEVLRRRSTSITIRFSDDSAVLLGIPGMADMGLDGFVSALEGLMT